MKGKILFHDSAGCTPLPDPSVLRIAAAGTEIISVTDTASALSALGANSQLLAVVTNKPDRELFSAARERSKLSRTVLVTEKTMEDYSRALQGEEDILIDHVIAVRSPNIWTINELRVTLQKIIRHDLFGVDKYLAPNTVVESLEITGSEDRDRYNNGVMNYAESNRLGQYLAKLVFGITEELLMNAIYDAPIAAGLEKYRNHPRNTPIHLAPEEFSTLSYGCDGTTFAISVTDPFGALTKEKLFQYLKKVLKRRESKDLIDTKKGGAGLGLFKILYSSHSLVCNVHAKKRTEVMALVDVAHQVRDFSRMPRSIHYFEATQECTTP